MLEKKEKKEMQEIPKGEEGEKREERSDRKETGREEENRAEGEGERTEEENAEEIEAKGQPAPTGVKRLTDCLADESGIGVVEIILILVILIGLVVIFKSQITAIVETIFEAITSGVSEVVE